ncbi:lauroyl acyltransferase [Mangrovimicrobium sediminis]|uniref:Lauroyl acyltransferase n=1 Tax=Mangrovimicrobium sediminis TaxID=2562682 RepID=A0A4Z0LX00_9GAMM|nr:lysophospholipid acyltransferase family protein [Haliea sp. SAOS-164]TGD71605.1 lauroyl acyltransferase [Haliea sp. SAOS-164]
MAEFIIGYPLRKLARARPGLQRALWRLDYGLVWGLVKLFGMLPIDGASAFGERVGRWIGPRLGRKNEIFHANLAVVFPQMDEAGRETLVRDAWGRAGRVLAEYPHLAAIHRDPERVEVEVRGDIETCRDPSRPAVFVAAHLSNWEVLGLGLARLGIPMASLYSPPTNPMLDRMLRNSRAALNSELVPRDNSARELMRCLKQGRSVGMIIDRRVDEGSPIPFFGRDKLTTLVPARLALKHHCELVPIRVQRREGARFRVTFYPPVCPADSAADPARQAQDMTRQVHKLFEEWISAEPSDWMCSKRMWPKVKIGESDESGDPANVRQDSH